MKRYDTTKNLKKKKKEVPAGSYRRDYSKYVNKPKLTARLMESYLGQSDQQNEEDFFTNSYLMEVESDRKLVAIFFDYEMKKKRTREGNLWALEKLLSGVSRLTQTERDVLSEAYVSGELAPLTVMKMRELSDALAGSSLLLVVDMNFFTYKTYLTT
jgi:hypothetical protein